MDKCNQTSAASAKGSGAAISDKSKQDCAVSTNKYQKYARRREVVNVKDVRKPKPIATKLVTNNFTDRQNDRRPRQRSSGAVAALDSWSGELTGDQLADGKKPYGSKKHNLNHLLNFSFTSRDGELNKSHHLKSGGNRLQRHVRYNKEQFVQANCQFVVRLGKDYSHHLSDPDLSVDWDAVEEIRFNSLTSETVCPICLHPPVAAKITRCGHIYCWSCLLHYLSLSDQKWRKCPICFDAVRADDLRSVSSVQKRDCRVADQISLCLVKRKKGCVVALPSHLDHDYDLKNLADDLAVTCYQKILVASSLQVLDGVVAREKRQLEQQIVEEQDTPEVVFLQQALEFLHQRESMLTSCSGGDDFFQQPKLKVDDEKPIVDDQHADDYYYFYQAEDGQHIYLHSLNVRMLVSQFGSLKNCPAKIQAKIVEMDWFSMNEQLKKRLRYLQHLPLTCEIRIVELALEETGLLTQKTLEQYGGEVKERQRARKRRDHEEKKRTRFIQVEENKKIFGIYPLPKYQLNNYEQFPECTTSELHLAEDETESLSSVEDHHVVHPQEPVLPVAASCSPPNEFPSFASMLREGKAKTPTATAVSKDNSQALYNSDGEYQAPHHNYSLSDAFQAALELRSVKTDQKPRSGGKKSRKNKEKLLFSTGMRQ